MKRKTLGDEIDALKAEVERQKNLHREDLENISRQHMEILTLRQEVKNSKRIERVRIAREILAEEGEE